MSDIYPSAGQTDNLEHSDENHAKKVNTYVWDSGSGAWVRQTQPGSTTLAGSNAAQKDTTYYGDGVISGIAAVGIRYFDGAAWNRTPAVKLLWDDTTTANTIYVGKAPIGTATSAGSWQIQKINTSTKDIKYAASGAFTATWDNRATSETYS